MSAQLTLEVTSGQPLEPIAPARRGSLRRAWNQIVRAVREMNHANRRLVEVQAPWAVDPQWHRR